MYKKRIWLIASNILYIAVVILVLRLFMVTWSTSDLDTNAVLWDTARTLPSHPDTLLMTYKEFSRQEELKKKQLQYQQILNQGSLKSNMFTTTTFIGIMTVRPPYKPDAQTRYPDDSLFYCISLPGYKLEPNSSFTAKSDQEFWLKYPVWDSITDRKYGHYAEKQVPFRFAYDKWEERYIQDKKGIVMIPISKKLYNGLYIPMKIISVLMLGVFLLVFVLMPVRILFRISRGIVFTERHVRELHFIAIAGLAIPFVTILMQVIFKLVYRHYLADEVLLNIGQTLTDQKYMLAASVVFFTIAKAFKRGLALQNDQDLTV